MATSEAAESTSKSFAGIPEATFIEDVDDFMREQGETAPPAVLQNLEEQHRKYKFMEMNLVSKKKRLKDQLPEIESSLQIVHQLEQRAKKRECAETLTHFLLSDQVYGQARVPPSDTVYVWMGAGCMLEYPLCEADAILSERLATASGDLSRVEHDIDFLRDQLTTVQVNIARVYNWDVKRRQLNKSAGQ